MSKRDQRQKPAKRNLGDRAALTRAIELSLEEALNEYGDAQPAPVERFFFGAYELWVGNLAIWFIFETNADLALANENGSAEKLRTLTRKALKSHGWDMDAFEEKSFDNLANVTVTDHEGEIPLDILTKSAVRISFTSKEDIDTKANGSYTKYFM